MTSLLAGDIGGTKTLLALYRLEGEALLQERSERFVSADWPDFTELLRHFLAKGPADEPRPSWGCLAVAGPVRHGRVKVTNLPWELDQAVLTASCELQHLELVNDFAVLIYGLPHLSDAQQRPLRPVSGGPDRSYPVAILGAGTGLGVALGIPGESGLQAIASEASHGEFAPRCEQEWQLKRWLMADLGLQRLSIERVVSGTGLGEVMRWLLAVDGHSSRHPLQNSERRELPAATAAHAEAGDPLAQQALQLWLGAYGSAAGDIALHSLCLGGLWVGGGTAGKLLSHLQSPAFLEPLLAKGRLSTVLEQVPVMALTDPEAGIHGAACRARMLALAGQVGH
jgi:glucokinase